MTPPIFSRKVRGYCSALALVLLAGCAKVNDTGLRLVSTNTTAYLQINGQLLDGNVLLVPDRSARVSFVAEKTRASAKDAANDEAKIGDCAGSMRYTATFAADVDLHCDDGTQVALHLTLISETRGYGYGTTPQGPASMAFGLPEAEARAFMGRVVPE